MEALFLKLLNMSITATWLVLAVLIARLLLKKALKAIICALWALVAVRLLVPFSFESVLSLIPSAETVPPAAIERGDLEIHTGFEAVDIRLNGDVLERYVEGVTVPVGQTSRIMTAVTMIWMLGVAVMLAYALVSFLRMRRKVSPAVHQRENIYLCDYIATPFILGILRPRIYLPSAMDELTAAHVIAHEKAHLKRKDHWWKPLGYVLLAVHWFNPALWLSYILLCRDIELACDEKVIRDMNAEDKKAYSSTLLRCSVSRRMIAACPLAFGEVGVKERVKAVAKYKKPAFWIVLVAIVACTVVAVCFLTDPKQPEEPEQAVYQGVVIKVDTNSIIIGPTVDSMDEQFRINIDKTSPRFEVGDNIQVIYSGEFEATYPRSFKDISYIFKLDDDGNIIDTGTEFQFRTPEEAREELLALAELENTAQDAVDLARTKLAKRMLSADTTKAQMAAAEVELKKAEQILLALQVKSSGISRVYTKHLAELYGRENVAFVHSERELSFVDTETGEVLEVLYTHTEEEMQAESWLDNICKSAKQDPIAEDCIAEHEMEFRAFLGLGEDALEYCFREFLRGEQDTLKADIMAIACQRIMMQWGEEDPVEDGHRGQAWFNVFRRTAWWLQEELSDEQIREEHPAAWAYICMFDGVDYSECSLAGKNFSGVTRAVLTNIDDRSAETQITNAAEIQQIIGLLQSISATEGESARGYIECHYWLQLYEGAEEVFSIGFGASPEAIIHYGTYPDGYAIRWHVEGKTGTEITEFLAQFE